NTAKAQDPRYSRHKQTNGNEDEIIARQPSGIGAQEKMRCQQEHAIRSDGDPGTPWRLSGMITALGQQTRNGKTERSSDAQKNRQHRANCFPSNEISTTVPVIATALNRPMPAKDFSTVR